MSISVPLELFAKTLETGNILQQVTTNYLKGSHAGLMLEMSDRMPDRMPEDMPGRMPEDMPDRMPDRMPEDMSDRMPEDLPVTNR